MTPPREYPEQPVLAVGAIVFHHGRVLMVKRGKAPAAGLWSIPGGRIHLGETLRVAAQREIMEETGVVIEAGEPVYTFDIVERHPDGRIRFHYVIVDLLARYISGTPVAGDDADDARWISPEEIEYLPINPKTLQLLSEKFGFGS